MVPFLKMKSVYKPHPGVWHVKSVYKPRLIHRKLRYVDQMCKESEMISWFSKK